MPTISMFYGILILMYHYDDKKHSSPHIHAEYGDLLADWKLAVAGEPVFKIEPLR